VLKKFDGMEDDSGLPLTKMILDYTCEQWVEKYRAAFIHCSCPDSQERLSDRKMDDWGLEMFCVTERKTSPNDSWWNSAGRSKSAFEIRALPIEGRLQPMETATAY
jgi:hypothetical protein